MVTVETSPAKYVHLIGPRRIESWRHAISGNASCWAQFEILRGWPYARIEIENADGKRAYSQSFMVIHK